MHGDRDFHGLILKNMYYNNDDKFEIQAIFEENISEMIVYI